MSSAQPKRLVLTASNQRIRLTQPPHYGRIGTRNIQAADHSPEAEAMKAANRAVTGAQMAAVRRGRRTFD